MLRQRARTLQAVMAASDAAATCIAFFIAYYFVGILSQKWLGFLEILPLHRYLWLLYISVPLWLILLALFGCYDLSPLERIRDNLRRMAWPLIMGAAAIGAAVFFSKELLFSRRVVGAFAAGNIALLLAGRTVVLSLAPILYHTGRALRRILIIGTGDAAKQFGETIRQSGWGLALEGYIAVGNEPLSSDCLGAAAEISSILDERAIDDVVLVESGVEPNFVRDVIRQCEEVGVRLHIPSEFFAAELSRPHLESFRGISMLTFSRVPYNPLALGIKRAIDILFSVILGIVFSVPMLIIAIFIKATSPGPILFRQRRCGLYGREFLMYKFRTMVADAEEHRSELDAKNEMAGPVFKMREDPRVTPVGRRLRRHSLDELPQLWNVLKGDMSLIGPRPPLPKEVREYERWQRRRLSMRPGLTCIWQVTDRNYATFDKWMEYDLQYIDHWSLWLDFKILIWTIGVVVRGTGI
jgi:exopolysaccharide biosynthesis polyprenyl glycosylphosphotransferase